MKKAWLYFTGNNNEDTQTEEGHIDVESNYAPAQHHIVHLDASLVPSKVPDVRQLVIRPRSIRDHVEKTWVSNGLKENFASSLDSVDIDDAKKNTPTRQAKDNKNQAEYSIDGFDSISSNRKPKLSLDRAAIDEKSVSNVGKFEESSNCYGQSMTGETNEMQPLSDDYKKIVTCKEPGLVIVHDHKESATSSERKIEIDSTLDTLKIDEIQNIIQTQGNNNPEDGIEASNNVCDFSSEPTEGLPSDERNELNEGRPEESCDSGGQKTKGSANDGQSLFGDTKNEAPDVIIQKQLLTKLRPHEESYDKKDKLNRGKLEESCDSSSHKIKGNANNGQPLFDDNELIAQNEEPSLVMKEQSLAGLMYNEELVTPCHRNVEINLTLTNDEEIESLDSESEFDSRLHNCEYKSIGDHSDSSSNVNKSLSAGWSLLGFFRTQSDVSKNMGNGGSTMAGNVVSTEENFRFLKRGPGKMYNEDACSSINAVDNDYLQGKAMALINITDPHIQTDNKVIIDANHSCEESDEFSESNPFDFEVSKQTEGHHETRCLAAKSHEDGCSNIEAVHNTCQQEDVVALSNIIEPHIQTDIKVIIDTKEKQEEEDALSESNPFGFEASREEVHLENRATGLEEDPFGFETEKEDQEALLESFRIKCMDTSEEATFSHSRRSQPYNNTMTIDCYKPHPNQPLFDILDRNIESLNPLQMHGNDWNITAEDVKLCFFALVMILSPPKPIHYAEEYNHNLDEEIKVNKTYSPHNSTPIQSQRWFFQRRNKVVDSAIEDWVDDSSDEGSKKENDAREKEKENYSCTYIPLVVAHALWTEVLKSGTVELAYIEEDSVVRDSVFNCIKESLIQLELVDTRSSKVDATNRGESSGEFQPLETDQITLQGHKHDCNMIAVHHAISQQYGKYIGGSQFCNLFNDRKVQWFSAVTSLHLKDSTKIDEYKICMLPHTMIQARKYEDAKELLCDKKFIRSRLLSLGILNGTTAQVTDIDELFACIMDDRSDDRLKSAQDTMVIAYEQVKKAIERRFRGPLSKGNSESNEIEDMSMCTESGKAFHLMAISLGGQGIGDKEHEYFTSALRLKQLGVKNENELTISISDTLHCMGFMYDNTGNFTDAIASYDQALQIRRALLGSDNLKVAETCHNKGAVLSENGQLEDAIFFLEKALKIRIRHLGEDHVSVADTEQWMGNIMRELGDSNEALDYFKNALRIKKHRLGDDDEDVASVLHNMAIVLDDLCNYPVSITCYTEALRIRELHYGRNSLTVADTLQSIGISYNASGDHANALTNFIDSIAVRENLLKVDIVAVDLVSECHIADVQPVTDDINLQYNKLIECYEEIIPLTKLLDDDPMSVVDLLEKLGETYCKVQDWDNAVDSFQNSLQLKIGNKSGSEYDLQAVGLLQKVGQVFILKGEYTEAHSYLNDALVKRKCLLSNMTLSISSQHHYSNVEEEDRSEQLVGIVSDNDVAMKFLAMNYYLIGVCFNKLNQHQKALISFTECLRILKKADKRDIIIGHTLHWLGRQHHGLQEYNKAISRYVSTLQIYRSNKSHINNQVVVQTLHSLGNSHFKNDQLQMALKCYNEEIKLSETARSLHNSSNVAEAFYCAGNIYAKMKCYDKAVSSFEKSLTEMRLDDGIESIRLAKGLDKLGTMYIHQKELGKGKEMLTKAWLMFRKVLKGDDLQSATVAFRLAQVLDEVQDFNHAIGYYDDCLRVRETLLGTEHEMVAATLFCMGKNCCARSKFDDAIDFHERALHIRRNVLGVNDVVVASTLHELGRAYWSKGVHDKAMVCYRESLRIWKSAGALNEAGVVSFDIAKSHEASNNDEQAVRSYMECIQLFTPKTHTLVPSIHHSLGILLEKMGKWSQAVTQLEICFEMYQSRCFEHNLVISAMHSLCRSKVMSVKSILSGDIQIQNERRVPISDSIKCVETVTASSSIDGKILVDEHFTEALHWYTELQKLIELNGRDCRELAQTYFEVGNIYVIIKDYTKAHANYEKSLTIKRNIKDSDDNITGKILMAIAIVNEKVIDFTAASIHAIEALRIFRLKRNDADAVDSLIFLARINESSCNIEAAVECFEECLKLKKQIAGDSDLSVASTLQAFSCLLIRTGDEDRALELLNSAVRIRKLELGIHHLVTAESVHMIGEVLMRKCQYEKSLKYILQALQVKIQAYGKDHEDIATSQHYAGVINIKCDNFEAAIPFLQDALRIREQSNAAKLQIARTSHHLGQAFWKISDHDKGIHYLTKASTIRKQELGSDSMDYADSLECLGCAYYSSKKSDEALRCLVDSLRIYEDNKCDDCMKIAKVQEWIGRTLFRLEKYDKALPIFSHCLTAYQDNLRKDHESLGNIFLYMGKIEVKLRNYAAAMGLFKQSLGIRKKGGGQSVAVSEVLMQVGDLFLLQGDHLKALDCFNESVRIMKRQKVRDAECIASALCNVGRANLEAGLYDEAMTSFEEARSIYSTKYGGECVGVGETLVLIASVFEAMSTFGDAVSYYMDAFNILKKHVEDDDTSLASIMHHLGMIYAKERKFTEAEEHCHTALKIRRKRLSTNHVDIADTLAILADVKNEMGETSNAISLYKEACEIFIYQKKEMNLAHCLESMACIKLKICELDDALSLYSKAWKIRGAHEADDTIEAAANLFGLGVVHHKKLRHEEALNFLKRCLNLYMVNSGKDTLDVAKTCEELGHVLLSMERYEDALKVYDTALCTYQDILSENHLRCASINLHVGEIFSHLRKYDVALQHFEASLKIYKREFGESCKEVACVFLSIGKIHDLQVDMEKAMKYMSGALKIQIKLYGKDDVNVADTLLKIARVLEDWGDTDEAMDCFHDTLRIYQLKLGQDNLSAALVLKQIGSIHYEREEHNAALEAYKKAIFIYKQKIGKYSSEVGHVLQDMGAIYDSMREYNSSLKCYSEALDILKKSLGNDSLAVASALNNVGINLARRKEYRKAIELCTDALHIRKAQLSENHLDIADVLFNIGNILDDWGEKDERTVRFYSEALIIYRSNLGDDNEDVANCVRNIGVLYMKRDKINEAIPLLLDALRIFRLKASDSLDVAGILFHLGRIYGKQANYDKSLGCFKECLRIRIERLDHDNPDIVNTRRIVDNIQRKIGR